MRIAALGSGALWLAAAPSLAQQPATGSAVPAEVPATPAEAAPQLLGGIVVTAQRREERLRDVPLSITAQTGGDLTRAGVTNVRELGNVVPGLSFTTQGTFAQPTIRGVQSSVSLAGSDTPIAIYIDGSYQQNQVGNVFDLPDTVRVEVLKGPQGTPFRHYISGTLLAAAIDGVEYSPPRQLGVSAAYSF